MIVIIILKISLKANISVNNHLMFDFHTFYVFDLCSAVMNTFVGEPIFKIRDKRPRKKLKARTSAKTLFIRSDSNTACCLNLTITMALNTSFIGYYVCNFSNAWTWTEKWADINWSSNRLRSTQFNLMILKPIYISCCQKMFIFSFKPFFIILKTVYYWLFEKLVKIPVNSILVIFDRYLEYFSRESFPWGRNEVSNLSMLHY